LSAAQARSTLLPCKACNVLWLALPARARGGSTIIVTAGTAYGGDNVSLTVVVNHSYKNACDDSRGAEALADTCDVATKARRQRHLTKRQTECVGATGPDSFRVKDWLDRC